MLKRALAFLVLAVCSVHAGAALRVKNFDSSVFVGEDGTALVTETITLHAPQRDLVRTINLSPAAREGQPFVIRIIAANDASGKKIQWRVERAWNSLLVHLVGDTDTFRLTYLVRNAATFAADHDEVIWPATDPNFTHDDADVRLALPAAANAHVRAQAILRGAAARNQVALWSSNGQLPIEVEGADVHLHAPGPLASGVVMTAHAVLDKGILQPPAWGDRFAWYVGANPIVFLPVLTAAVMMLLRRLRPRRPEVTRSVAARYEPPDELSPAEAGTLVDDHVDPRDVAATLVDLAVRGFLRIDAIAPKNGDPDFKITLLKPRQEWTGIATHEYTMLFHTFYGGWWTELSSLKLRFPSIIPGFTRDVMGALRRKGMYGTVKQSPTVKRELGFAAIAVLLVAAQLTGITSLFDSPLTAGLSIALSAIIVVLLGDKPSSKTLRGERALVEIHGFQEFLNRVDGDRLQRLTPDLYEKYLPYAMALGVERGWTAAFDEIAVPVPDWFGADGGLTDPALFEYAFQAFVTRTMHSIRNACAPRIRPVVPEAKCEAKAAASAQ